MKKPLLFLHIVLFLSVYSSAQINVDAGRMNEVFRKTDLVAGATDPWELTYGPDNMLWYTEAKGYRVRRISPNGGTATTALDLTNSASGFSPTTPINWRKQYTGNAPQGGLMGMAFHPLFGANADSAFVYIAYIRDYNGLNATLPTGETVSGQVYTTWITKWFWNGTTLTSPVKICDTIRGSNDHNSGRMIIAPDPLEGGQYFLYYAVGDMGAGQFDNTGRVNKSQWNNSYEGKILRYKLHGQGGTWVPATNPFGTASAVYAKGVRNNQGFAYDPELNKLYGTSHGPFSDDELNAFEKGRNYGHPLVIGYKNDNNYNNSKAATPASILPLITNEQNNGDTMVNYKDPVFSAYASTQPAINNLYLTNPPNGNWPSEGWSGLGLYADSKIPGWKKSLLAGSLKWGRVVRIKLDATGEGVMSIGGQDTISYFGGQNRFRDLAFDENDGRTFYVSMDNSTTSSGPSSANPIVPSCTGCIHKYTFLGYHDDGAGNSSIRNWVPIAAGAANLCESENSVVISPANNNSANNLWVPITDNNSNIVAEIRGNTQNLGTVTTSVYRHTGAVRKDGGGRAFLDRNIQISTQNVPAAAVKIRLYITAAELAAIIATPGSAVANINQLSIFKSNNSCSGAVSAPATRLTTTRATFGTGYVLTADVTSFSSFYFASSSLTTLPTDLLSFTGDLTTARTVKLDWKTATELNVANYVVERSIDGNNYEMIGTITARNDGSVTNLYTFTDMEAGRQSALVLYYRLRIVDIDQSSKYSNIVNISLADMAGKVYATPNPAMDETKLTINALNNGKGQWSVVDNAGRVVMQSAIQLRTGNNNVTINIRGLAAGMYYLDVKGGGINTRVKLQKL